MGRTWTTEVGHSTRALEPGDVDAAVSAALAAGGNIVELSALDESQLDAVATAARGFARRSFRRLSVHAPAAGPALPESELAARLAALDVPVVVHPQVITDPEAWRPLGRRLLVENGDGRKAGGRTAAELAGIFAALPDARFCLDVSHALHAGGPPLVDELAAAFGSRLEELHAGCGCGEGPSEHLGDDVLRAVARAIARAGRPLPVIIERPATSQAQALAQVFDVRGAVVASVRTSEAA